MCQPGTDCYRLLARRRRGCQLGGWWRRCQRSGLAVLRLLPARIGWRVIPGRTNPPAARDSRGARGLSRVERGRLLEPGAAPLATLRLLTCNS